MILCPQIDERQLLVSHRLFERAMDQWSTLAVKTAEEHAKAHVKLYSKFKRRGSKSLKDAAQARHFGTWKSKTMTVRVYVNAPNYAPFIEYGTRSYRTTGPTPIVARRARFLRFYWPKVGRVVFLKRVMHPGNKPYKFLWNATHSAYRVYGDTMSKALDRAAESF